MCLRLEFPLTSSWKPRDLGAIVYNLWYRKTTFSSARLRAEAEKDTDLGSAIIESQPEVFVRVATQLSRKICQKVPDRKCSGVFQHRNPMKLETR